MEGRRSTTGTYYLHICNRGQPNRFCWKKNYEFAENSAGLAMGYNIYTPCHFNMATDGARSKYSFWTVPVFYPLCQKVGRKDGCIEEKSLSNYNSSNKFSIFNVQFSTLNELKLNIEH